MPRYMIRYHPQELWDLDELCMHFFSIIDDDCSVAVSKEIDANRQHHHIVLDTHLSMEVVRGRLKASTRLGLKGKNSRGNASYSMKTSKEPIKALAYALKGGEYKSYGFPESEIQEAYNISYKKADVKMTKKESDRLFYEELDSNDNGLITTRLQPDNWYDFAIDIYLKYDKNPAIPSLKNRFNIAMIKRGDIQYRKWHKNKIIGDYIFDN